MITYDGNAPSGIMALTKLGPRGAARGSREQGRGPECLMHHETLRTSPPDVPRKAWSAMELGWAAVARKSGLRAASGAWAPVATIRTSCRAVHLGFRWFSLLAQGCALHIP